MNLVRNTYFVFGYLAQLPRVQRSFAEMNFWGEMPRNDSSAWHETALRIISDSVSILEKELCDPSQDAALTLATPHEYFVSAFLIQMQKLAMNSVEAITVVQIAFYTLEDIPQYESEIKLAASLLLIDADSVKSQCEEYLSRVLKLDKQEARDIGHDEMSIEVLKLITILDGYIAKIASYAASLENSWDCDPAK